jgi:hypothetical protein
LRSVARFGSGITLPEAGSSSIGQF